MLGIGQEAPDVRIWTTPRESATTSQLVADGPILLVFYLFDWSST